MFDVGFAEIFLLALIGLLVLGPERLPGVARTLGGFVRKARMSWVSLRNTIESELSEADLSTPIKKASEELKQIGKELTDIPSFKSEDHKPKANAPDLVTTDVPEQDSSGEPGSGKSENV
jgi:sec-independent protein translocase protein TatB